MRLLVVEDNAVLADGLRRGLVAEGFDVDVTADGLDGLWRVREFSYDLVLLDILLPGMNGYEVCRTLRREGCQVPIVMLTAKDGEDDEAEGLDLGADDYITKPFSLSVLVARVRAVLRRVDAVFVPTDVIVGDVSIDVRRRRCTVAGRDVALTHREFSLLEALARRAGVPVTRTELFELVWGADHEGSSNVVDVYVGYVRRKLSGDHADDTTVAPASDRPVGARIETVRGIGYRMVA